MIVTASQNYVRCSSQKLKEVADSVRKLSVEEMRKNLSFMNKEAARRLLQTLDQAVANATHNHGLGVNQVELESLLILRGPHYKRMRAVSRGQGHAILKRTSHIVVKLRSIEAKEEVKKAVEPVKVEEKKETVQAEKKPVAKTVKKPAAKKAVKQVKKEE